MKLLTILFITLFVFEYSIANSSQPSNSISLATKFMGEYTEYEQSKDGSIFKYSGGCEAYSYIKLEKKGAFFFLSYDIDQFTFETKKIIRIESKSDGENLHLAGGDVVELEWIDKSKKIIRVNKHKRMIFDQGDMLYKPTPKPTDEPC